MFEYFREKLLYIFLDLFQTNKINITRNMFEYFLEPPVNTLIKDFLDLFQTRPNVITRVKKTLRRIVNARIIYVRFFSRTIRNAEWKDPTNENSLRKTINPTNNTAEHFVAVPRLHSSWKCKERLQRSGNRTMRSHQWN